MLSIRDNLIIMKKKFCCQSNPSFPWIPGLLSFPFSMLSSQQQRHDLIYPERSLILTCDLCGSSQELNSHHLITSSRVDELYDTCSNVTSVSRFSAEIGRCPKFSLSHVICVRVFCRLIFCFHVAFSCFRMCPFFVYSPAWAAYVSRKLIKKRNCGQTTEGRQTYLSI